MSRASYLGVVLVTAVLLVATVTLSQLQHPFMSMAYAGHDAVNTLPPQPTADYMQQNANPAGDYIVCFNTQQDADAYKAHPPAGAVVLEEFKLIHGIHVQMDTEAWGQLVQMKTAGTGGVKSIDWNARVYAMKQPQVVQPLTL